MIRVSIVGGAGYVAGELLRLLLRHPRVTIGQVVSSSGAGRFAHQVHPHLRGATELRLVPPQALEPCDLLLLARPHGDAARNVERYAALAPRLIDTSADFRLRDPADYARWYGTEHAAPEWLGRFVYGLPEIERERLRGATHVSGVGCNATAAILALRPLARAGLLDPSRDVVVDLKVGSSEAGRTASDASHHPERAGAMRAYAPVDHRHTAEVRQALAHPRVHLAVTAVERVRGVLAAAHVFLAEPLEGGEKALWRMWRECWNGEPFVRIVHERQGHFRHPDPKLLDGTNVADVGFALDAEGRRVVAMAAIDNLMKGAAGSAVQCMNLMHGFAEDEGLESIGVHPR